jgi:glycosyltransferase involved in cell wall biosynthesis
MAGVKCHTSGSAKLPVSVIIPAYNAQELLPRAIASVMSQRPAGPEEVIVIDDGSSDGTAEVAERLGARVIRHGRNLGLSAARNTAVRAATQAWVALLDADDEWLPHHLRTVWPLRDGHLLVAGSGLRCGADPLHDAFHGPLSSRPVVLRSPACLIYPGNFIMVSAAMIRREVVEELGGFQPAHGVAEDFDMWIRAVERGSAIVSPVVTTIYHIHEGQMSSRANAARMQKGHITVAERYKGRPWWAARLVERWRGTCAWNNVRAAVRDRRGRDCLRALLFAASHPQRLVGVGGTWSSRFRLRRHSSALARDGGPSVAILRSELTDVVPEAVTRGQPVHDLSATGGFLRAYARLLRRPAGLVLVGSMPEAILVRVAGSRPARVDKPGGSTSRRWRRDLRVERRVNRGR